MKELYLKTADMNLPKLNEEIVTPENSRQILSSGER